MAIPPSTTAYPGQNNSSEPVNGSSNSGAIPSRRHRGSPFISWLKRGSGDEDSAKAKKLASPAEEIKMVFLRQIVLSNFELDGKHYHSVFTGAQIVDIILAHFGLPDRKLAANIASRLIDCSLYIHVSGPSCDASTASKSSAVIDSNAEIYTLTTEAVNALKAVRKGEALQRAKTQTRKKYMDFRGHLLHPLSSDSHGGSHSPAINDACSSKSGMSSNSRSSGNSQLQLSLSIQTPFATNRLLPPPLDVDIARGRLDGDSDVALQTSRLSKTAAAASPQQREIEIPSQPQNSNDRRSADSPADTLVSCGPLNAAAPSPTLSETAAHEHENRRKQQQQQESEQAQTATSLVSGAIGSPLQQVDIPDARLDGLLNTWSIMSRTAADETPYSIRRPLSRASARKSVPSLRLEVSPRPRQASTPLYTELGSSENDDSNKTKSNGHINTSIDTPTYAVRATPFPEPGIAGPEADYQMPSESHRMFRDSVSMDWLYNNMTFTRRRWGIIYNDARDTEIALCRGSSLCSSPKSIHRCPSAPSLGDPPATSADDNVSYAFAFPTSQRPRRRSIGSRRYSRSLSQYNDEGEWNADNIQFVPRDTSRLSDITIASSYIGTQFRGPMDISISSFASGSNRQSNGDYHSFDPLSDAHHGDHRLSSNQGSFVSYGINPSMRFSWNQNQARRSLTTTSRYAVPARVGCQELRGRFSMAESSNEPLENMLSVRAVGPDNADSSGLADNDTEQELNERFVQLLSSDGNDVHRSDCQSRKSDGATGTTATEASEVASVDSGDVRGIRNTQAGQDIVTSDDIVSAGCDRASSVTLDSQLETRPNSMFGPWQQQRRQQQQSQLLGKGRRISISAEPTCAPRTSREVPMSRTKRGSVHSTESSGSTVPGSSTVGGCMQLNLWRNTVSSEFLQSLSQEMIAQQEAIYEIICTEQHYLRDLELIDVVFSKPLLDRPEMVQQKRADEFLESLFYNYTELIENSRMLVAALEDRASKSSVIASIADIFDEWANDLSPFIEYSVHVPVAQYELEAELLVNQEMAEFLAEAEAMPEARRLPIQSFIGRPATRFARYPLLLNAVIKRLLECGATESDDDICLLKGAVEKVRRALTEIDRRTGERAKQLRIRQIGQRLRLVKGARESLALDSPSRRLIKEGVLYAPDGATQVLVFLFDNSLIMATEEKVPYAKSVTRYIADERIIPISMLDVYVPTPESGNSALLGIREALGLHPSATALPSPGARPMLLRHTSSASSMKNKAMAGGGGSLAAASGKLGLSFLHIGCRSLCRTLFVSSSQEREQWEKAIKRRISIPQTLVEAYTDFRVLSDRDFSHPRGPLCSAPFASLTSPGCQMILFGNKDGLHLGIYGVPTSVVKVSSAAYVTRIHILRKHNIVLVLSDSNLLVYSLADIERATAQIGNGVAGSKIASSVGFFDVGTYIGGPLIVLMKPRGSKSHFKCIQPMLDEAYRQDDGKASGGSKEDSPTNVNPTVGAASSFENGEMPTLRVVYQGNTASLRLISEFSVPGKTKRVHFLRRKLCIVGAKSFEVVDVQQSRVLRSLPDQLDDDFSFVHSSGGAGSSGTGGGAGSDRAAASEGNSGQALAICKVGREFLLCYESFAFYIDNFGRRSRPDIFIRWEMRPQVVTFRHPYIVAINPKFLEIRHVETGVLLSIIRMKRSMCLNPDSRSLLLHMAVGPGPVGIEIHESPQPDSAEKPSTSSTPSIATTADVSEKGADSAIASITASTAMLSCDNGAASNNLSGGAISVPIASKAGTLPRTAPEASSRPISGLSASFFKSMAVAATMGAGGASSSNSNGTSGSNSNSGAAATTSVAATAAAHISHIVPGLAGASGKRVFPECVPAHYRIIEIRLPLLKQSSSSSSSSRKNGAVDVSAATAD
ncbi:RHO1 GDP-GTP exchange protein 2 [Coemansia sp. RSA 1200]|nr:RHO1 GDP-GTP exchange protein 2 [Coemansia sp. RSA 1200]